MKVTLLALDSVPDDDLAYAVIGARCDGRWIFVRHRDRTTWEMPGGHRELGEAITETAHRELFEETGSTASLMTPVCDYSVLRDGVLSHGRLYHARVEALAGLPAATPGGILRYEIVETTLGEKPPGTLTYPEIQPLLMERLASLPPL
jgi:8-oxo-dGTP diphosphatase